MVVHPAQCPLDMAYNQVHLTAVSRIVGSRMRVLDLQTAPPPPAKKHFANTTDKKLPHILERCFS